MRRELILKDHEGQELLVRKYKTGELGISVRGYTGSKGVELTVLMKQALKNFLNTPEPREWVIEVNKHNGNIIHYPASWDTCDSERVKVREVMPDEQD